MEIKKLTLAFEMKETSQDDEFFYFKGYGSTFGNVDLGDDMVVEGAFANTIKETELLPILWQHNSREPVGVYSELKEDSHGLFVEGKMPLDDDFVKGRVIPQMKIGSIKKLSIGYSVLDSEYAGNVRMLKELKLHEISLVTFPMNTSADITNLKTFINLEENEQLAFISELKDFYAEKGGCPLTQKIEKAQIDEVKSVRDAEELFKTVGFSQTASKAIISVIRNHADEEVKNENVNIFAKELAKLNK
jgi:hypothetical protein